MAIADIAKISRRVEALRRRCFERDARMQEVYDVRTNNFQAVMPGTMPEAWPKSIVANSIDTAARQLAETLASMPSINCSSGTMTSPRAKKAAEKRTKIAYSYVQESNLRVKLPQGCDWYLQGFLPIVVEPDFETGRPFLRFDNPMKAYPQVDLHGRVIAYTKVWRESAGELADKFPQYAKAILGRTNEYGESVGGSEETQLECIKYCDKDCYVLYLPERRNLILHEAENTFGKVPVAIAFKPSFDGQTRGQFDDVPYIQMARARMAMLGLQATQQNVRAPLAIPPDVQRIPMGDDSIIRTSRPQDIRRVGTDIPTAAWQQEAVLMDELNRQTRTPKAASGDIQASIITGQGVKALNEGYDVQIATGQTVIGKALEDALSLAFEMDEAYWPDHSKTIRGMINGTPFEEEYQPSRDIKGNHQVQVSYGFASGLNPNQALVFLLQLRNDREVSRDFVQRQLPMDIDVTQMQAQIDIEETQDALKQGVFTMLSSVGIMAQQGMDPTETLVKAASLIEMREKGVPIHEAVMKAFAPPEPPPGAEQAPAAGLPPAMPGAAGAPAAAGGQPSLMSLLAGLTQGGEPNLQATVRGRIAA